MEIRQLRYLVAVAAELNFTRAAARAQVAQPALSRQIRRLEDELGVVLVDRGGRLIRLTPAGEDLAERARGILADLDAAAAAARTTRAELSGRVVLGVSQTTGPIEVPEILRAYRSRHPRVVLSVREEISVSLADGLRADEVDLAIVADLASADRHGLQIRNLSAEPLVAVLSRGDDLSTRGTIRLSELTGRPLAVGPVGASVRRIIGDVAARDGFALDIAVETNVNHRIFEMVADGLAVSVMPALDVPTDAELVTVPIEPALQHHIQLAWRTRRQLSPAADALARLILSDSDGD